MDAEKEELEYYQLDELIAEKVMGLVYEPRFEGDVEGYWRNPETGERTISEEMPSYSTDIAAAWSVAEKLGLFLTHNLSSAPVFAGAPPKWHINDAYSGEWIVEADTAQLAICVAALKVVEKA